MMMMMMMDKMKLLIRDSIVFSNQQSAMRVGYLTARFNTSD
jgi:hypothetical protein